MSLAEIRTTVETLREQKAKRSAILAELKKQNPAYGEDELRRLIEMIPTERAKKAAQPARLVLLALEVLVFGLKAAMGVALLQVGDREGWLYFLPSLYLAFLFYATWHSRYDVVFLSVFLLIGQIQATAFALQRGEDVSPIGVVVALAIAVAAFVWRAKAFPNLDWRSRVRPKKED